MSNLTEQDFRTRAEQCIRPSPLFVESTSMAARSDDSSIRKILLLTDFSNQGRVTRMIATGLSKKLGAKIALVHIGKKRPPEYSGVSEEMHRRDQLERLAFDRAQIESLGVETTVQLLVHQNVSGTIGNIENQISSDLVVAFVSASTWFDSLNSIDYAGNLLANSTVPILLIGPRVKDCCDKRNQVALLPFDLVENSGAPMQSIDWVVSNFDCRVVVAQVIRPELNQPASIFKNFRSSRVQAKIARRSETLQQEFTEFRQRKPDTATGFLQKTDPVSATNVLQRANELNASLIVLSAERRMRNQILKTVREARCPVLVLPKQMTYH